MAFPEDILFGVRVSGGDMLAQRKTTGAGAVRTVAPWDTPVSLQEVKDALHITHSVEDADITLKIKEVVGAIETLSPYTMMEQTWVETLDRVPRLIQLSRRPVTAVSSIKYVANFDADTQVLISSGDYILQGAKGEVIARSTWPSHRGWQSFEITYKAGYATKGDGEAAALAAARTAIPSDLKSAVKSWIGYVYSNREGQGYEPKFASSSSGRGSIPPAVLMLLDRYLPWGV